jgi:hypothetical protein
MIDYQLKKQMEQALLEGRKQDALILSQKLDVQIVQATKAMIEANASVSSNNIERSQSL